MEIAHFEPKLNDKYRLLILYENEWRPIFWFQVKNDGSIYLGPRYKNFEVLKSGSGIADNGKIHINYADGENITDPSILKIAGKTSFHASGIINTLGDRQFRNNLREIREQELLCFAIFQHPNKFKAITQPTSKDICINYAFDEDSPLQAQMYIAPEDSLQIVNNKDADYQIVMLFPYKGFDKEMKNNITLQICLNHSAKGPWPPQTYLVFPTIPNVNSS